MAIEGEEDISGVEIVVAYAGAVDFGDEAGEVIEETTSYGSLFCRWQEWEMVAIVVVDGTTSGY